MSKYDKLSCPIHNPTHQSDQEFDKMLSNIGINIDDKMIVFLTVCIVLRLFIAGLSLQYYDTEMFPYLMLIATIFALLIVGNNINSNQWWSRKTHFAIISLMLISSFHQITTNTRNISIPLLLYTDVAFGIATFGYVYYSC